MGTHANYGQRTKRDLGEGSMTLGNFFELILPFNLSKHNFLSPSFNTSFTLYLKMFKVTQIVVVSLSDQCLALNTSYLTDSCISFTLKLESRLRFFSNSLIRSITYDKKNICDFPPCGKMVVFVTEFLIFLKTSK